ncbi:MAG: SDR family NAD(P)-dependent oxidoreductase [Cyanobacteria bacterium P01_H01_bin.21]
MDQQSLAIALLQHNSVVDCVVTQKRAPEFTAYLVLRGRLDAQALDNHLQTRFEKAVAISYIPVSRLPLTAAGAIDQLVLEQLKQTKESIANWEDTLNAESEVQRAAVVLDDFTVDVPVLHLSDLLPEWQAWTHTSPQEAIKAARPDTEQEDKPNAIATGPSLIVEENAPTTLSEALERSAKRTPDHGITYIYRDGTDRLQTYPELLTEASQILGGLQGLQLMPQAKLIFQFDDNADYIPAFWGCMLGGYVPVPVAIAPVYEPGNAVVEKLINTWRHLEAPVVLTNESVAAQLRPLLQDLQLNVRLVTIESLRTYAPATQWYKSQPDDLAVLLFTSGSTGTPKGVMLRHHNILSNVAASAQVNDFDQSDMSLNWLRLDHVGSLVRCSIRDIYVGSNQIHAPAELVLENPLKLLDWVDRYKVTFAWAPNFALGLINNQASEISDKQWDLSHLRSMLSVAEAIVPNTARTFTHLLAPYGFKANMMHAAWGMSETCAAVTFSHNYLEKLPDENYPYVEVGAPTAGFQMRIVDNNDQLIAEEVVGRLQIKGPMILSSYYQNPELNATVFTEDGWFKTGDLGYLKQGNLTVTGREKDIIIINGLNHFSPEIEAIVEEVDGVKPSYTAACGLRQPGQDTDQLLIFFAPEDLSPNNLKTLLKTIQSNIVRKLGIQARYLLPVEPSIIPKTSIGKIQRLKLKQCFQAGKFDQQLKESDLLLENDNTLPDWFYQPVWQRHEATQQQPLKAASKVLIFLDELGLGQALMTSLTAQGHRCVGVCPGDSFEQVSGDLGCDRYYINPIKKEHYQQLLETAYPSQLPDCIVHLWLYRATQVSIQSVVDLDDAQQYGTYSLLHLAQVLNHKAASIQATVRLQMVASHSQMVDAQDLSLDYSKSPVLGLLKTLSKELPWLDCRHLDLSPAENNIGAVLKELEVPQLEREAAYRQGHRFVSRIGPVELSEPQPLPYSADKFYLITGGLGGVGIEIAKYLLQHHQAKLVLIGRQPLEQSDAATSRKQRFEALQTLGGQAGYAVADVCDQDRLSELVQHYTEHWNMPLGGIIHLAGAAPERLLVDETVDSLAATLRAKVSGTWVLHQLIKEQLDGLFVTVSSVISLFGGATVGAYAASNTFLNQFQQYAQSQGYSQHYCFRSSTWSQIGVNQGYQGQDSRQAQGQIAMSAQAGLQSLLMGLRFHQTELIFGLDRQKPAVQTLCLGAVHWMQQPVAYLETELSAENLVSSIPLPLSNHTYRFEQIDHIPLKKDGQVDKQQLQNLIHSHQGENQPQTPTEEKLAAIWKEVLGISTVSRQDNFFELGGTSVLAARLFLQIEQGLDVALPLASLFQAPTIAQLGQMLEQENDDPNLWSSLVPIRSQGNKPPLFLVHAGFGDVVGFEGLVRHLDSERPVYALRPMDLSGQHEPLSTIETMAAHYVAELQKQYPEGPYFLGGQCTGGTVAFEMAQQLTAQGHVVEFLGLLDTSYPRYKNYLRPRLFYYDHPPQFKQDKTDAWFYISSVIYRIRPTYFNLYTKLSYHLGKLKQQTLAENLTYIGGYIASAAVLVSKKLVSRISQPVAQSETVEHSETVSITDPEQSLDAQAGVNQLQQSQPSNSVAIRKSYIDERFFESFLRAQQNYVPKSYDGRVDFFLSTRNTYVAIAKPYSLASFKHDISVGPETDLIFGWDEVATNFQIHEFDSRHEDMVSEPYVQRLAQQLNQCLGAE